jgi:glucose dehydrogenase
VWAIWGAGYEAMSKGLMLILIGIPVYLYVKWRESREPAAATTSTQAPRRRITVQH